MATANQQRFNANWEGMLKRWIVDQRIYHRVRLYTSVYDHPALSDGTDHHRPAPQWRGKTQKRFMIHEPPKYYDICDRVYDIACGFTITVRDEYMSSDEDEDDELEWMKGWLNDLDELQAYAEFNNLASLLHSEGCLFSFLRDALSNKHAGVRAKIAEIVTTMVHKYPASQQLLTTEKVLQLLLNNFTSDPDETSRTKALGAISSLIMNNKSGITAFRREKGYAALRKALISGSVCQRELVNLIECLLHENNLDFQELNLASRSSDDAEVREVALTALSTLVAKRKVKNQLVKNDNKLKQVKEPPPPAALPTVQSNSSSTFPLLKKRKKKRSNSSSSKRMKLH